VNTGSRRTPPNRAAGRAGARPLRSVPPKSFLQRNRGRLLGGLAAVAVLALAGIAYLNATSPAYACGTEWSPAPTPTTAPGATPRLGYVQTDTGREHIALGSFVKYPLCPPATGKHNNAQGEGPIKAGLYGPDDATIPQGWIHNLEHGGLVLLYRCASGDSACTDSGQTALKQFTAAFPNSPICNLPPGGSGVGPVVTRFDQMKWPYAALIWGVVLPLDTLDTSQILAFFAQQGERTNPEPLCARPTATPAPTGTPAPSSSASAAATGTPPPTAAPTVTPAPTASPAPTPAPTATPAPTPGAS
jgi:hypothetical protein